MQNSCNSKGRLWAMEETKGGKQKRLSQRLVNRQEELSECAESTQRKLITSSVVVSRFAWTIIILCSLFTKCLPTFIISYYLS